MAGTTDVNIGVLSGDDPKRQIESVVKQVNENFRLIANEDRTQVVKDDAGTERLLIGYQNGGFSNGNVGIKLSKEGVNVLTAESDELVFSSAQNTFTIVGSGTLTTSAVTLTTTANKYSFGQNAVSATHGLGYIPAVIAYVDTGTSYSLTPYTELGAVGDDFFAEATISVTVDANQVFVTLRVFGYNITNTTTAKTVKYYLLTETAN